MDKINEEYLCDCQRPDGFTYYTYVTVCNNCLTQFPFYDCYCELQHDDCTEKRRLENISYRIAEHDKSL